MAEHPKIEFYKFKLKKKSDNLPITFRTLFREKFQLLGKVTSLNDFFKAYETKLISELDGDGYYVNNKRKKGYTIDSEEKNKGQIKSRIKLNSQDWIISGVLDGGKHGKKRTLGTISNKADKKLIKTDNIVCDKFYFLLSTPIDHSEGIIMIQGYTELKISDIFRDHMRDFFSYKNDFICVIEIYVPDSLKNKYLKDSTFNSATFSTGWVVTPDFEELESKAYNLQVEIKITDRSDEKMSYEKTNYLVSLFGKSILKMGKNKGKEKELNEFDNKRAKINSNGKPIPIKFDKNNHITPVIYLEDEGINIDPDTDELNFEQVDGYCRNLLEQINNEHLPNNAVQEL